MSIASGVTVIITLLCWIIFVDSKCSYIHRSGYSLKWLVHDKNVVFHFEYDNFPSNAYTGVGFGDSPNIDSIVVRVNEGEPDAFTLSSDRYFSPYDVLNVTGKNYSNLHLRVDFSRPVLTSSSDLNSCITWKFLTMPTRILDIQYSFEPENLHEMQVCHIKRSCDASKLVQEEQSLARQTNVLLAPRMKRTARYSPADNVYGYDYSSPSSSSDRARLVINPNYNYLNDELSKGFARNYVQVEEKYEGTSALQGDPVILSQTASLNNDQQNAVNYQQIQKMYGMNSNIKLPYLESRYGHVADNPKMYDSRNGQILPISNGNILGQGDIRDRFTPSSTPYRSAVDLKTTRLRDSTVSSFYVDPLNAISSSIVMYYPYRTATGRVVGGDMALARAPFRDANTDPCSLPDPYWCSDYIEIYTNSSTGSKGFDRQIVCPSLIRSLQDSYNGCCHATRAVGCR